MREVADAVDLLAGKSLLKAIDDLNAVVISEFFRLFSDQVANVYLVYVRVSLK